MTSPHRERVDANGSMSLGRFMERLTTLPLHIWSETAMRCPAAIADDSARALDRAFGEPSIALLMWSARDEVEMAICRFDYADGRAYIRTKGSRLHIRLVTERAALAILVRESLGNAHFDVCYGGFEHCVPVASLLAR